MRFAILTALTALALAGSAIAQPITDHPSGVPGDPRPTTPSGPFTRSPREQADIVEARQERRLVCATDQEVFCKGKTGSGAGRCIWLHRDRVGAPCKQAMTRETLAEQGRL